MSLADSDERQGTKILIHICNRHDPQESPRVKKRGNQPQNHSIAKGAHRQVDKPVLVEVQLPMDAAAKILEARSQL